MQHEFEIPPPEEAIAWTDIRSPYDRGGDHFSYQQLVFSLTRGQVDHTMRVKDFSFPTSAASAMATLTPCPRFQDAVVSQPQIHERSVAEGDDLTGDQVVFSGVPAVGADVVGRMQRWFEVAQLANSVA